MKIIPTPHADPVERLLRVSHEVDALVTLLPPEGEPGEPVDIPVTGGRVTGDATQVDRWASLLDLAGDTWAPRHPTDPLGVYSRHRVDTFLAVDGNWLHIARGIPVGVTERRSTENRTFQLQLVGTGGWLDRQRKRNWAALAGETAQQMLVRMVTTLAPPVTPTVVDTTTPEVLPVGAHWDDASFWDVAGDLAALAGAGVYFDPYGDLIIRPTLGTDPTPAGDVTGMVTGVEAAPSEDFANWVQVTFTPAGARRRKHIDHDWALTSSGGTPSEGEARAPAGHTWFRLHYLDGRGRSRRRELRRIEPQDVLTVLGPGGAYERFSVTGVSDDSTARYVQMDVEKIVNEGTVTAGDVTFTVNVADADVVGTASGGGRYGLDPATIGRVAYEETRAGSPTQARADAYARAVLDASLLAGVEMKTTCVDDPRIEPDDDVTLTLDRRRVWRVVTVEHDLAGQMDLTLRAVAELDFLYPSQGLYPSQALHPSDDTT